MITFSGVYRKGGRINFLGYSLKRAPLGASHSLPSLTITHENGRCESIIKTGTPKVTGLEGAGAHWGGRFCSQEDPGWRFLPGPSFSGHLSGKPGYLPPPHLLGRCLGNTGFLTFLGSSTISVHSHSLGRMTTQPLSSSRSMDHADLVGVSVSVSHLSYTS